MPDTLIFGAVEVFEEDSLGLHRDEGLFAHDVAHALDFLVLGQRQFHVEGHGVIIRDVDEKGVLVLTSLSVERYRRVLGDPEDGVFLLLLAAFQALDMVLEKLYQIWQFADHHIERLLVLVECRIKAFEHISPRFGLGDFFPEGLGMGKVRLCQPELVQPIFFKLEFIDLVVGHGLHLVEQRVDFLEIQEEGFVRAEGRKEGHDFFMLSAHFALFCI